MSWIILEGLDRTGKSSVADHYKKMGYEVHHMSAPDKKFAAAGYAGPSYTDEILDIYMRFNGKDVVFDRSPYGEMVWPIIYSRLPQLNEDDFEILRDYESANAAEYILMFDPNTDAHWRRCVLNKEPLTKDQFDKSNILFERMAAKYNFKKTQLSEMIGSVIVQQEQAQPITTVEAPPSVPAASVMPQAKQVKKPKEVEKLEQANAINDIMTNRILKKKGDAYDQLETEIRSFLQTKLSNIFGQGTTDSFSKDEIQILKTYAQRIKEKMGDK